MFISDLIYDKICKKSIKFWKTVDRQLWMSIVRYSRLRPYFESNKLSFDMETQRTNTSSEPTKAKPEILPLRDSPGWPITHKQRHPPEESLSWVAVVVFHRSRVLEERVKHKSKSR